MSKTSRVQGNVEWARGLMPQTSKKTPTATLSCVIPDVYYGLHLYTYIKKFTYENVKDLPLLENFLKSSKFYIM